MVKKLISKRLKNKKYNVFRGSKQQEIFKNLIAMSFIQHTKNFKKINLLLESQT